MGANMLQFPKNAAAAAATTDYYALTSIGGGLTK